MNERGHFAGSQAAAIYLLSFRQTVRNTCHPYVAASEGEEEERPGASFISVGVAANT